MPHFYKIFLLSLLLLSFPLIAENHYYVVCAYEDAYNTVGNSHVFARFMEVSKDADFKTGNGIKNIDISWLPEDFSQTLSLGVWVFSYPGKSFSFDETLAFAKRVGSTVKCTDVMPTTQKHFQLAEERLQLLNSGNVKYQALSWLGHQSAIGKNGKGVTNCIYSVGDLAPEFGHGTRHGWASALMVSEHLQKNGFNDLSAKKNDELVKFIENKIEPYSN